MNKKSENSSGDSQKYILSGGAECTVVRKENSPMYLAVIHMAPESRYPEVGEIAKNSNRSEYIYCLNGSARIHLNNEVIHLAKGESVFIDNGDTYSISAESKGLECVVLVTDGDNAESIITHL